MGTSEIANLWITTPLVNDKPKMGFVTFEPPNTERGNVRKNKNLPTKDSSVSSKNNYQTPTV